MDFNISTNRYAIVYNVEFSLANGWSHWLILFSITELMQWLWGDTAQVCFASWKAETQISVFHCKLACGCVSL